MKRQMTEKFKISRAIKERDKDRLFLSCDRKVIAIRLGDDIARDDTTAPVEGNVGRFLYKAHVSRGPVFVISDGKGRSRRRSF